MREKVVINILINNLSKFKVCVLLSAAAILIEYVFILSAYETDICKYPILMYIAFSLIWIVVAVSIVTSFIKLIRAPRRKLLKVFGVLFLILISLSSLFMAQMTIWTIGDFKTQKAETIDTDNEPLVTHSKTRFNIGAKEFVDMMNSELQYYDVPMLTEKKDGQEYNSGTEDALYIYQYEINDTLTVDIYTEGSIYGKIWKFEFCDYGGSGYENIQNKKELETYFKVMFEIFAPQISADWFINEAGWEEYDVDDLTVSKTASDTLLYENGKEKDCIERLFLFCLVDAEESYF